MTQRPNLEGCTGATIFHENGGIIVYLPTFDKDLMGDMGTLVHESVHVFQNIMEQVGEHTPGIETQAYSVQEIFITLFDEYAKQKERTDAIYDERQA